MPEGPPYSEYVRGEVVRKIAPQRKHVSLVEELSHYIGGYRRRAGGFSGAEQRVKFETERAPIFACLTTPIGPRESRKARTKRCSP